MLTLVSGVVAVSVAARSLDVISCMATPIFQSLCKRGWLSLGLAGFGSLVRGISSLMHFAITMLVPVGQYILVVVDVLIVVSLQINLP